MAVGTVAAPRGGVVVANDAAVAPATETAPAGAPPCHWLTRRAAGPALANGRRPRRRGRSPRPRFPLALLHLKPNFN